MIRWVRDSLPRRRPFLGFSVSSMRRTVFFLVQGRSEERESEKRERRRWWWFGFVPFLWSRLSVTPVNWNGVLLRLLRFCPWTTIGNYERIMTTFDELAVRFFRFVRGAITRVPQVYVGILARGVCTRGSMHANRDAFRRDGVKNILF